VDDNFVQLNLSITRTQLSQTDRASATHTIRWWHL